MSILELSIILDCTSLTHIYVNFPFLYNSASLEIISWAFCYRPKYPPENHYQPESFSSRADNGRGLILKGDDRNPVR